MLKKVAQPGLADTLYEYDRDLHQIYRTGLDVKGNGTLDGVLSSDRITQHTTT